jgi:hypothetical protein
MTPIAHLYHIYPILLVTLAFSWYKLFNSNGDWRFRVILSYFVTSYCYLPIRRHMQKRDKTVASVACTSTVSQHNTDIRAWTCRSDTNTNMYYCYWSIVRFGLHFTFKMKALLFSESQWLSNNPHGPTSQTTWVFGERDLRSSPFSDESTHVNLTQGNWNLHATWVFRCTEYKNVAPYFLIEKSFLFFKLQSTKLIIL